jgi:biotin carboxyl carrier protein
VTLPGPVTQRCSVTENGKTRVFMVTVEPGDSAGATAAQPATATATATAPAPTVASGNGTGVYSTFAGSVEVVDIMVKTGDRVSKGQAVAAIEALKTKHDITSPVDGTVGSINVAIGDEVDSSKPIMVIS